MIRCHRYVKVYLNYSRVRRTWLDEFESSVELQRQAKALALSVAYGANIGGIATITGSPPNLVFKENGDR